MDTAQIHCKPITPTIVRIRTPATLPGSAPARGNCLLPCPQILIVCSLVYYSQLTTWKAACQFLFTVWGKVSFINSFYSFNANYTDN